MKTAVRLGIGLLTLALLVPGPGWAKKNKGKGGPPPPPPTITADQAKAAVSAAVSKLTPGTPYSKRGRHGDVKLEVPLLLEGKIVAKLRLNPTTGEILVKGQKALTQQLSVTPEQAAKAVQGMVPELTVGAAWLGKKGEWKVPLLYKGAVVAVMGVHGQNGSILPDWKASRDATMSGK